MDDNIPAMWYRNQGYSTIETGDIQTAGKSDWRKIFTSGIQKADRQAIIVIANSAKYQVEAETDLEVGSDEYWSKVDEITSRAIFDTQPNYDTLHRPQILRSKKSINKINDNVFNSKNAKL